MAADCKSAAPCELRRFESSPVHQDSAAQLSAARLKQLSRFSFAMVLYAVLAVLAVVTLTATIPVAGKQVPLSGVTLLVLALFAFRTWLHHKREMLEKN